MLKAYHFIAQGSARIAVLLCTWKTNVTNTTSELTDIIERTLALCAKAGTSAAEVDTDTGQGLSVTVRMGELEKIEHERDKGLSVTVYMGKRKGSASTTDFSDKALQDTVKAACTIAKNASEDEYAGLIDPEYVTRNVPALDLYHPWDISAEAATEIALHCENEARKQDKRINNSDGVSVGSYTGSHAYGNSHQFVGGWDWSSHTLDCSMIAEQGGHMQRDGWYSRARDPKELQEPSKVGRIAADRTVARLDSRKISTRKVPVIFEAPIAGSLFSSFIGAISGGALYRKASFLLDKLEQEIFASHIDIHEEPHLPKAIGSAPFDNDGMATKTREFIKAGVLKSYVLSAYSARKLGMAPTGNAGGIHNLIVKTGQQNLQGLIKSMDTGLLITDMIGFGVNQVTGDYSRGASGFWIENGEIQYPVEEITVAGNLLDMYRQIVAIGNDVERRGNIRTGSVLIENMAVAGE